MEDYSSFGLETIKLEHTDAGSPSTCYTPITRVLHYRKTKIRLHRDGGTSPGEMSESHPRIFLKIAYVISDQTDSDSGATILVPGSNRLIDRSPIDPETGGYRGAIAMNLKPGNAFLFEQRT